MTTPQPTTQRDKHIAHLQAQVRHCNQTLNAVARIITTIELCREGVWEEHKPALDSILRDLNQAGFYISPDTLAEVTSERLYN
jgi:hypothetical protein